MNPRRPLTEIEIVGVHRLFYVGFGFETIARLLKIKPYLVADYLRMNKIARNRKNSRYLQKELYRILGKTINKIGPMEAKEILGWSDKFVETCFKLDEWTHEKRMIRES